MWLAFLTNISSFAHSLIAFFENVTHVGQCDGPVCEACSIVAVSPRDCACSIKALIGSLSGIANVSSASWEPYPIIHKFLLDLSYTCNFHFFFKEIFCWFMLQSIHYSSVCLFYFWRTWLAAAVSSLRALSAALVWASFLFGPSAWQMRLSPRRAYATNLFISKTKLF